MSHKRSRQAEPSSGMTQGGGGTLVDEDVDEMIVRFWSSNPIVQARWASEKAEETKTIEDWRREIVA